MAPTVLQTVWPVLAVIAFLLITAVLSVLATQRWVETTVHDRIRDSKALRQRYLETIKARQQKARWN